MHTPLGDDVLLIQSMTGREELGKLFEYQVEMTSETTDIDFSALVGDNITVSVKMPDDSLRYFNGYVSRFAQVDVSGHDGSYQATMVPWLWFLTRTADCRIFQEKTVPDIIDEVFRDAGFSDFEAKLSASYRPLRQESCSSKEGFSASFYQSLSPSDTRFTDASLLEPQETSG
ncbi:MAG: contractile injection system protein, VgrG/Pvc8 family, partial [Thiohalomonadales bacterium]